MKALRILILLILISFPLGQLEKLPLGIAGVSVYLHDIFIFLLILYWLIYHLVSKKPIYKTTLCRPILGFFLVSCFSLIINLHRLQLEEAFIASLYLWRWIFYAGVYFVITDLKLKLKWEIVLVGVCVALFGLIQYFVYPDLSNLVYLHWDPHRFRIFGTFLDPGFLGMLLVLIIIWLLSVVLEQPRLRKQEKFYFWFAIGISYVALALTYSRSSYLAYIVAFAATSFIKRKPKIFLVALILGFLTILILPRPQGSEGVKLEREESIWSRVKNWQQTSSIIKDNPLFGVGFNTLRHTQKQYGFLNEKSWEETHSGAGVDSSLLFVWATTGLIGLLLYIYLCWRIIIIGDLVLTVSAFALFIHSWFLNSLFYPWIMLWMWIIIGLREKK